MYTPRGVRRVRAPAALLAGIVVLANSFAATALAGAAAADATDDYPIPHRMILTTCTAEQILAAARDFSPIDYQRYTIDRRNKPPEVQQAAMDSVHYFYSLSPQDRRAYSEQMATHVADPMTLAWPNWAKVFFNNKGVVAKETDNCANYPPDDASVWDG